MLKISQREAHRLRKRVYELEQRAGRQNNAWCSDWPGGVHIATLSIPTDDFTAIHTARKLGHAVVVVGTEAQSIRFMAIKN